MIFTVSVVDAGTVDLIRNYGKNVVSSADLIARFEATWTGEQIGSHFAAGQAIDDIMMAVFRKSLAGSGAEAAMSMKSSNG
jgi:Xaa-Pro dipeptidase